MKITLRAGYAAIVLVEGRRPMCCASVKWFGGIVVLYASWRGREAHKCVLRPQTAPRVWDQREPRAWRYERLQTPHYHV